MISKADLIMKMQEESLKDSDIARVSQKLKIPKGSMGVVFWIVVVPVILLGVFKFVIKIPLRFIADIKCEMIGMAEHLVGDEDD